jgi:hypothetical protein
MRTVAKLPKKFRRWCRARDPMIALIASLIAGNVLLLGVLYFRDGALIDFVANAGNRRATCAFSATPLRDFTPRSRLSHLA